MFVRKVTNSKGVAYLQIVRSVRPRGKGKTRKEVVFSLGRLDVLQATGKLDSLINALTRFSERLRLVDLSKDVSVDKCHVFGTLDVVKKLFERTALQKIVNGIQGQHEQLEIPLAEVVFALLVSRFVKPCSKLRLKKSWIERFYPELVCQDIALHQIYRTLDLLCHHKEEIQKTLLHPQSQMSLFEAPKLELVFYDTTTLRFESVREDVGALRRFGYSKEMRTDCTQVILGLMLDRSGLPVGYKLFPGNTYEGKTVPIILEQLKKEYGIRRLVFVADRGMLNVKTLDEVTEHGYEFIMGMKLWNMKEQEKKQIEENREWDYQSAEYRVKELSHVRGRLIITWSADRAKRDLQVRTDVLAKLNKRLGENGDMEKLIKHKGYQKYLKVIQPGQVVIDNEAVQEETKRDGLFGILTNVTKEELSAQDIVERYKELWKIEDAFGEIKGTLEARPMFHWTDRRIEGHMMVCFLAYYLEAFVTKQLRQENAGFTATQAFDALNEIRAVPIDIRGQTVWVRTSIEGIAAKTYQTLKVKIPSNVLKLPEPPPDEPLRQSKNTEQGVVTQILA